MNSFEFSGSMYIRTINLLKFYLLATTYMRFGKLILYNVSQQIQNKTIGEFELNTEIIILTGMKCIFLEAKK